MKILAMNCNGIETKLTLKSTKPKEKMFVEEGKKGQILKWDNPTAIFICVEKKDEENRKIAENAVLLIKNILREMNSNKLVLIPFVHLTGKIANPPIAYRIIKEIERRFMSEKLEFSRFQFGWHRDLALDIIGGNNAIKYRETRL